METWKVAGNCPRCGAPIYAPELWVTLEPPPCKRTCACLPLQDSAPVYLYPSYLQWWQTPQITWQTPTVTCGDTHVGSSGTVSLSRDYFQRSWTQ